MFRDSNEVDPVTKMLQDWYKVEHVEIHDNGTAHVYTEDEYGEEIYVWALSGRVWDAVQVWQEGEESECWADVQAHGPIPWETLTPVANSLCRTETTANGRATRMGRICFGEDSDG